MDGDDIDNSSSIDDGGSDECCSDNGTFDNDVVPAPLFVCDDVVPAPRFVCNDDDESFDDKSHNDCGIDDNVDEVGVGNNFDFDDFDSDDRWSDDGFVVPGVCITPLMDDDNCVFIDDGCLDNDDVKDDNEVIDDDGVDNDDCLGRSCTDGNEAGGTFNDVACVDDCGVIIFDGDGSDNSSLSNNGVDDDVESYNDCSYGKDDVDVIVFDSVMGALS